MTFPHLLRINVTRKDSPVKFLIKTVPVSTWQGRLNASYPQLQAGVRRKVGTIIRFKVKRLLPSATGRGDCRDVIWGSRARSLTRLPSATGRGGCRDGSKILEITPRGVLQKGRQLQGTL